MVSGKHRDDSSEATSLEFMVSKGSHPQMASIQVGDILQFTQMIHQKMSLPRALFYWRNIFKACFSGGAMAALAMKELLPQVPVLSPECRVPRFAPCVFLKMGIHKTMGFTTEMV